MKRYTLDMGTMVNTSKGDWVEYSVANAEIEELRADVWCRQEIIDNLCDQNRESNAEIERLNTVIADRASEIYKLKAENNRLTSCVIERNADNYKLTADKAQLFHQAVVDHNRSDEFLRKYECADNECSRLRALLKSNLCDVQFHHYIAGDGAEFAAVDSAIAHVKSLNEPYDVYGAVEIGHTVGGGMMKATIYISDGGRLHVTLREECDYDEECYLIACETTGQPPREVSIGVWE
jgi:hypothetical protein